MEKKHTPGPWRAEKQDNGDYHILYNDTGNWLAEVYSDDDQGIEITKSDAALISAAPDLLRSCEVLLEIYNKYANDNPSEDHMADMARAAIAKALSQ